MFQYFTAKTNNTLTHNHKYMSQTMWVKSNQISKLTTVNYMTISKYRIIQKLYLNIIVFNKYMKSYDVNQNNFFNLLCSNIILHNSIEQDADIIMILHQRETIENNIKINESKIIDLKVSKNRNGNIGSCKLVFIPKYSTFQSSNSKLKELSN